VDVSPCFLSDDLVALLIRSGPFGHIKSRVFIVRRTGSKLERVASSDYDSEGSEIYSVARGRVLVTGASHSYLYSPDLAQRWPQPFKILRSSFPRSEIFSEFQDTGWKAFRLAPTPQPVRTGAGELLAVSDDVIVSVVGASIRTETLDGRQLGSIPVGGGGRSQPLVRTAGPGALLLRYGIEENIADYNGHEMARLAPLEGWGFRYGWSDDGSRVLLDRFTRPPTFWSGLFDGVMGVIGAPSEPNGETIVVQDARNGRTCFRIDSARGALFGLSGGYHGDLSPFGKWVAVATLADVSIFAVPDTCNGK
jgi:hypothetical protein